MKISDKHRKFLGANGHLDKNGYATLYNLKGHESHKIHHTKLEITKYSNGVHGIHGLHDNGSKSHRYVGRKIIHTMEEKQ